MITSVHVGDLRNEGRNVLLVVTAEGWLHVFDFSQDLSRPTGMAEQEEASKSSGTEEADGLLLKMDSSPESVKKEEAEKLNYTDLLTLLYLCEASSEHPLAKAIVQRVKEEQPNVESDPKFKLSKFKNINGEGVVASITEKTH